MDSHTLRVLSELYWKPETRLRIGHIFTATNNNIHIMNGHSRWRVKGERKGEEVTEGVKEKGEG